MLISKILQFPTALLGNGNFSKLSVEKLKEILLRYHSKGGILAITGAGVSTDSGIPDYRGKNGAYTMTPGFKPITYQQFCNSVDKRKRYWARSFFGYPKFSLAKPNISHKALSFLESKGYINHIITQNVDNLHQLAGSQKVTEIHGTLNNVYCISCKYSTSRAEFQNKLAQLNSKWNNYLSGYLSDNSPPPVTPDGDILLPDKTPYDLFEIPPCPKCEKGFLKPDVVFFGENMSLEKRLESQKLSENANCILVIGSSLTTPSAYRLALQAVNLQRPLIILNIGSTRADEVCNLKIEESCSPILSQLAKEL